MNRFAWILSAALIVPVAAQQSGNPLAGRWDFNITTPAGTRAAWLGVTEKAGKFEIWYQPTGGNVYQVEDFKVDGAHLSVPISPASGNHPATTWELDASGGKLIGVPLLS